MGGVATALALFSSVSPYYLIELVDQDLADHGVYIGKPSRRARVARLFVNRQVKHAELEAKGSLSGKKHVFDNLSEGQNRCHDGCCRQGRQRRMGRRSKNGIARHGGRVKIPRKFIHASYRQRQYSTAIGGAMDHKQPEPRESLDPTNLTSLSSPYQRRTANTAENLGSSGSSNPASGVGGSEAACAQGSVLGNIGKIGKN